MHCKTSYENVVYEKYCKHIFMVQELFDYKKRLKQNSVQLKTLEHFILNSYTHLTKRKSNSECTVPGSQLKQ